MRSTVDQLAFSLFDNSERRGPNSQGSHHDGPDAHDPSDPTANVVALGAKAAEARSRRNGKRPDRKTDDKGGEDQFLGTLLWFTISNAIRLKPKEMVATLEAASLNPHKLLPRPPGASGALTRAATDAEMGGVKLTADRDGNTLDSDYHANILYRSTGRGVKQVVTEVLKDEGEGSTKRLFYQPLAAAHVENDRLKVELLHAEPLLPPEKESLKRLKRYFEFEKERYDGEAVRAIMGRTFDLAEAIPVRNSGGMYFIPREHNEYAENILTFVGEVRHRAEDSLRRKARPSTAFDLPLVDREEYRELLEDSLDDHIKKEAQSLIAEMKRALKSDTEITAKRQGKFVDRVKALKANVKTYEELLQMEATRARDNLDVAMKQARSLLGRE